MADWKAPLGIPTPSFGINEAAPSPSTIYVTDQGNDMNPGTMTKPRRTIPTTLAAGSVVSVSGTQQAYTSPRTIQANGTKDKPIYLLGGTYAGAMELVGSYVVVQNAVSRGGWSVNGSYIAFRDSEFIGGGLAIVQWLGSGDPHHLVVLRGNFHDIGTPVATWPTGGDDDSHGVGVGHHSSYVWILDSSFTRVSGDGIQVNGENFGALTHHIYIGRNSGDQNRQSLAWAKQSQDVVMSGNSAKNMRSVDGAGNPGLGLGAQYQATRVFFIDNDVSDSDYGIKIAGDTTGPFDVFVYGNRLHNIHSPRNRANDPESPGTALSFANNGNRVTAVNTITDVDTGVGIANSGGSVFLIRNTVTQATRDGIYESPQPQMNGDLSKASSDFQAIHGVPLGIDLGVAGPPVQPPPVIIPPAPPTKPPLPACPHTARGALGYIFGLCQW